MFSVSSPPVRLEKSVPGVLVGISAGVIVGIVWFR